METITDDIIPKTWEASKVGAPHCNGKGIRSLERKQETKALDMYKPTMQRLT
jgi:hypothetical protein